MCAARAAAVQVAGIRISALVLLDRGKEDLQLQRTDVQRTNDFCLERVAMYPLVPAPPLYRKTPARAGARRTKASVRARGARAAREELNAALGHPRRSSRARGSEN